MEKRALVFQLTSNPKGGQIIDLENTVLQDFTYE